MHIPLVRLYLTCNLCDTIVQKSIGRVIHKNLINIYNVSYVVFDVILFDIIWILKIIDVDSLAGNFGWAGRSYIFLLWRRIIRLII